MTDLIQKKDTTIGNVQETQLAKISTPTCKMGNHILNMRPVKEKRSKYTTQETDIKTR